MSRKQFMKALNKALKKIKKTERKNYLNHYDELISDMIENGISEQEAIEKQGGVKAIAEEIMENIEPNKLIRRDKVLIGLIVLDVVLIGINLWQAFWRNMVGVTFVFGQGAGTAVSVIGGADGPTSIFLAGKISPWQNGWVIALIISLLVTIIYIIKKRRKTK